MMPERTESNLETCIITLEPVIEPAVEVTTEEDFLSLASTSNEPPPKKHRAASDVKKGLVAIEAQKLELCHSKPHKMRNGIS
ncbi:hypothetical protein FKM82_005950 [Ascaphus truei]